MFGRASLYFLGCTTRNRVLAVSRRLREPKYILGLGLTAAYFWFLFFANPVFAQPGEDFVAQREKAHLIVGGFYFFHVLVSWFSLGSGRGVVFREAEVQILFPRPWTRWQVLVLKWLSAQFPILIGALLIGVMFRRFGQYSYPCVVLGFLLIQTALYAHSTLVGLVLARLHARGGWPARLTRLPAWTLLAFLMVCALLGWLSLGPVSGFDAVSELFCTPWMGMVLSPFTSLVEVMTATDAAAFLSAAVLPLVLIAAHALCIWWLDLPFEDQAVEIAKRIQNVRKEGLAALRGKQDLVVRNPEPPFRLAPTGPAWVALVWKNVISLGRFSRRVWLRLGIIMLAVGVFLSSVFIEEGRDLTSGVGMILLILVLYGSVLAPSLVRVDLRIDIPHFDVLKAMPLRGRTLIFGEVMGTVVVLWVFQCLACITAALLITHIPDGDGVYVLTWMDRILGLVVLACGLLALDFALVTVENLLALWLPGFARLGRGVRPGLDQMGQNIMGALIRLCTVAVMFLAPGFAGMILGLALHELGANPRVAAVFAVFFAAALLAAESYLCIALSDGRYERFDLSSEKITEGD